VLDRSSTTKSFSPPQNATVLIKSLNEKNREREREKEKKEEREERRGRITLN
jgi:hypothetical protein